MVIGHEGVHILIVLNYYGGPAVGKSYQSAVSYTLLKKKGYRVELVGEYAKELIYEQSLVNIHDQLYLFAEQSHRLRRLARSGIEIAVCDSPLMLNIIYNQSEDKDVFDNIVLNEDKKYTNFNYLLTRNKKFYIGADRIHTYKESVEKDNEIKQLLDKYNISYVNLNWQDETKPVEDIERMICIDKGKSKIIS